MLARWNPWQELADVEREMRDLSRRVFGSGWGSAVAVDGGTAWTPAVDIFSRKGDLVVRADLPGIDPEKDVDITIENGVLTIKGERRHEEEAEDENYYRFESSYGSFQRSIPLPKDVRAEDIQASYDNGILEVTVPKAAEVGSAEKVPVTAGASKKALTADGKKK